jgi:hypothetical protein
MLDDPSNVCVPSQSTSVETGFLGNKECNAHKIEENRYEYHDRYWLEMFCRALKENDQCIQKWLQQKFSAIIINWMHNHAKGNLAYRLHSKEYYIIETFRSFWSTLREQQEFELESMADVLSHLYVSMNGVILETLRNDMSPQATQIRSTGSGSEVLSNENDYGQEIWGLIESQLANAHERRIAYLLFQCALKPVEIVESFPDEFKNVNEISRIRRNVMDFLLRGDQISFAMNKFS